MSDQMRVALERMVDEFGCSLELLDRNGPNLTCADGEFVHSSVLSERREIIEQARAALSQAPAEDDGLTKDALRHARTFIENRYSDLSPEKRDTVARINRALDRLASHRPDPGVKI